MKNFLLGVLFGGVAQVVGGTAGYLLGATLGALAMFLLCAYKTDGGP